MCQCGDARSLSLMLTTDRPLILPWLLSSVFHGVVSFTAAVFLASIIVVAIVVVVAVVVIDLSFRPSATILSSCLSSACPSSSSQWMLPVFIQRRSPLEASVPREVEK